MREEVTLGEPVDGVTTYFVGQQAAWAGLQELTKEDLEKAEITGFPIVALILLIVFGSLAAASLPLALGGVAVLVTGGLIYALSLPDGDVGLRDQHGLDDRDRRRRRLLPVHPRPVPRGGAPRRERLGGPRRGALDLRASRSRSRASP